MVGCGRNGQGKWNVAGLGLMAVALASFVGTHLALSHPLRAPLVGRLGERGFQAAYSVVALATFVWAVQVYKGVPEQPLWVAGIGTWHAASLVMWVASVLFVGSVTAPNPALAGMPASAAGSAPRGVLRITRHPMMWSFAIWAAVHATLAGDAATLLLCVAVGGLALVGAAGQDRKKPLLMGAAWRDYAAATSFWPLGAQLAGRQPWSALWPGWIAVIGGTLVWLAATWAHPLFGAPVVGVWTFTG